MNSHVSSNSNEKTYRITSNCTIGSENITLFNNKEFHYEVKIAFNKTSVGRSDGIISGAKILCGNGNLNCPVVVKANLTYCNNSAIPPLNCSFNSTRTITFNDAKLHLQVKVIIKNISYTQENETLNFTVTAEFVKSLFPNSESRKVSLTNCSLAPTTPIPTTEPSTSISSYENSRKSNCLTDNIVAFKDKDIQYNIINYLDKSNKTEKVEFNNIANILCQNVTLNCPAVVIPTLVSCDSSISQTFDCPFNSTLTINFNETIRDLKIKIIIKNINRTQKNEALNFIGSTEFVKSLFSKLMPEKVLNLTNCSQQVPSVIPYSNGSFCTIGLQNRTLFTGNFQYEVRVAFNKSSQENSDRVINGTEIMCQKNDSYCPLVVKATLVKCFDNQKAISECLFNLRSTISSSGKNIDLEVTVRVSKVSDVLKNKTVNFTVSPKFVKTLLSEEKSEKALLTNCTQEEIQTTTTSSSKPSTSISTPTTAATTSATPGKKQKSKSSNGKIALVVLAFFILLGVAIIACYFKYKRKLSNRPAYYNDISLNDPLHTEIKFYKADGEDVEDNAEEEDDDDDVLPLI